MSIGTKTIVDCVNSSIANSNVNTAIQILQLSSASKDFDTSLVQSYSNLSLFPPAANNTGRMIYHSLNKLYYVSDGTQWISDFDSRFCNPSYPLWSWGCAGGGRLGDGTTVNKSSPVSVIGGVLNWCQVSAGGCHSLAVRTDGTLWSWGCAGYGILGDGTTVNKSSPVSIVGGFTDWCQVSAGCIHSLAIRTDGTAWAWGNASFGRLGNSPFGALVNVSSPVSVRGYFTNWCQVSAGGCHSLGVRQNGSAWAWGNNCFGQLGDNSTINKSSPVSVVAGFGNTWTKVAAGDTFSLGIAGGCIFAWGSRNCGATGEGLAGGFIQIPAGILGGFTDWCDVSAGCLHGHGVRSNGTLWSWGANSLGQLGDGTTVNKSSPVSVVGGFTDWCQVSSGISHNIALRTNGSLWAWGCGGGGRLGDNQVATNRSSPVSVVGGFTNWCRVSAGGIHNLALRPSIYKGF